MRKPPLTLIASPAMFWKTSELRNRTTLATSSGSCGLPGGTCLRRLSKSCLRGRPCRSVRTASILSHMAVGMIPRHTAFTMGYQPSKKIFYLNSILLLLPPRLFLGAQLFGPLGEELFNLLSIFLAERPVTGGGRLLNLGRLSRPHDS
jgi:hypothetical protein